MVLCMKRTRVSLVTAVCGALCLGWGVCQGRGQGGTEKPCEISTPGFRGPKQYPGATQLHFVTQQICRCRFLTTTLASRVCCAPQSLHP